MTEHINGILSILRSAGSQKDIDPKEVRAVARYYTPKTSCSWIIGLIKIVDTTENALGVQSRGFLQPAIEWMEVQTDNLDIKAIDGLPVMLDPFFTARATLGRYADIELEQYFLREHEKSLCNSKRKRPTSVV